MYIQSVSLCNTRNRVNNYINFNGELEQKFFDAARKGNKRLSLSLLYDTRFNIAEKDSISGNNFLHVICKEGSKDFLLRAVNLLKPNRDAALKLLSDTNKEGKKPLEYISDKDFIAKICAVAGISTAEINKTNTEEKTAAAKEPQSTEKIGNEVDKDIDLSGFNFDTDFEQMEVSEAKIYPNHGMSGILGLERLKQVFSNEIINPIKKGRNVFTNGFLIHGFSGNGKTYSITKLAEELNRSIVLSSTFVSMITGINSDAKEEENEPSEDANGLTETEQKISKYVDSVIVKINPDNIREIPTIADILRLNCLRTGRQGFIFMDEIQKFFPADNSYINNISAIQSIENSAKNGMIILATTRDIEAIDPNLINSLHFERLIENKMPNRNDALELINNLMPDIFTKTEAERLSKRLTGFSYNDIARILEHALVENRKPNFNDIVKEIENFSKEHSITELTEEGTTCGYDTFLKRNVFSETDPKSLDDVVGMEEVKKELKKVFDPIKKEKLLSDFYKENKIKKPNGILLYGPPGCGKTYIMSALAADAKLPMYQVKISDISSSLIDKTPRNIKKVFDQLKKKYAETGEASILFFDECDSLFAKSADETYTKVLNTLKEEMNNAGENGVYVVAATNEKDNLNTAITRDGRFDTKIEVGYPDKKARKALIERALKAPVFANSNENINIDELVDLTSNMSNATITSIFSKIMSDKSEKESDKASSKAELYKLIKKNPIKHEDIKAAIKSKREEINKMNLKQRSTPKLEWQGKTSEYDTFKERTYYGENDPKSLDDVIGMEDVKKQFKLKVLAPLNPITKELYKKLKLPMASGIILHGPGGVGKTYIVKAAAAESKIPLYELKISEMGTKWMNETANNIQALFNQLKRKYKETGEPSILFMDECDSLLSSVSNDGTGAASERMSIMNALKTELADAPDNGIMVIAATNEYKNLDPNVIRSGRFNDHIKIDYPDEKARFAYINHLLNKREITAELSKDKVLIQELVNITDNMSNSDIQAAIENAITDANSDLVDEAIKIVRDGVVSNVNIEKKVKITPDSIKNAISEKRKELDYQRGSYDY